MKQKPITLLKNKTVVFLDDKGIQHYGTVKRECKISFGPRKNTLTGKMIKRSTFPGYLIHQTFKRTGLNHKKEHRVPANNVIAIRVKGKDIPITEFLKERLTC